MDTENPEEAPTRAENGICVLGVRRSGTSLVAGVLHRLGVYLGEDGDLQPPDGANPLGYWELPEITALNDELLARLGGSRDSLPELPEGWEDSPELAPLRERARALLDERFSGLPNWGWKDPRNSVTLPFWRRVLSGTRCVICVRNPVDVAQSLRAIGGEDPSLEPHMSNWLRYTALAIENTNGCARLVVDYDDFFAEPNATVRRLARFVALEDRPSDADIGRVLEGFVDPTLALFRTPAGSALQDERVSREAAALYGELRRVRGAEAAGDQEPEALAKEWRSIERLAHRLRIRIESGGANGSAEGHAAVNGQAAQRLAELEELVADKADAVGEREESLATAKAELESERAALTEGEAERARLAERLREAERRLEAERARTSELDAQAEQHGARAQELDERLAELGQELAQATEAAAASERRATEAEANSERQRGLVAERDGSIAELQARVAERDASIAELGARVAELQHVAARELEQVAERDERLVAIQSQVAELLGHVERWKAAVEERDARLQTQKQFLQEQREDFDIRDAQHQQLVQAMRQSRSWRVTRPYRRTAIFFRGITGRGDRDLKP